MSNALIPESAPFDEEQRAWLNGFLAGLMGIEEATGGPTANGSTQAGSSEAPSEAEQEEEFPWHDPALDIDERMKLAEGKPLNRRLMAAMAQLDCGSCGYLCQSYSEAIASGEESNLTLCSPGGKETTKLVKLLVKESKEAPEKQANGKKEPSTNGNHVKEHGYSRKRPFAAKLLESRKLNLEGSAKDTRHVSIDLAGSGLTYHVGDALGVCPTNCDRLVERVIQHLGAESTMQVESPPGQRKTLHQLLKEDCCLRDPSDELLELLRDRCSDAGVCHTLDELIAGGVEEGFDVLDALELASSVTLSVTELIEQLNPLNPRLYSIASSQRKFAEQVHLTVGAVRYEARGRARQGVASTLFADRLCPGDTVRVFVQPNHGGFTVPDDSRTPIIMVGPGTGIAPFLSFLQEREASDAASRNWLFFGDQHEACDFLYREELNAYVQSGLLDRLDTAFSRDGEQKVYVQDRMRQQAAELWKWLQDGAHFYVCGDASRMAADVDLALREIVATEGKMGEEDADAYVKQMLADRRYARDVY